MVVYSSRTDHREQAASEPACDVSSAREHLVASALTESRLDAYASNKAILHQMSDGLPGSRVLSGSWGEETFAFGIPKGRDAARPYLEAFAKKARDTGAVRRAAERAGVRGLASH